jgi:hypothetical protein
MSGVSSRTAAPPAAAEEAPVLRLGESRWPPALALLAFLALNVALRLWLPPAGVIRMPWLLPGVETVLLLVLLFGDPARLAPRRRWLRPLVLTLVSLLVAAALWGTVLLVYDLIKGIGVTNSPQELLASGGLVWLGNNLAFALLYWLIDGGGPFTRSQQEVPVDFAFVQQLVPELRQPDWKPVFLDYLHLGFTNSTAFSPTDTMPLSLRAKYAMLVQSTVSLALFGLIVARAVNAFT